MVIIDEKDMGKTREELLMDLVSEHLGFRIPIDKIVFGQPTELDQRPDLKFDPNTFISARVDIRYDDRFSLDGSGFMYRRRSIVEHAAGCDFSTVSPMTLPFTTYDLIEQFNRCLPYPIDQSDIVFVEYKTKEDYAGGVSFKAAPHSLFWIDGEKIQIDDRWITGDPVLAQTELPGFYKWTPPTGPSAQARFNASALAALTAAQTRVNQRLAANKKRAGLR